MGLPGMSPVARAYDGAANADRPAALAIAGEVFAVGREPVSFADPDSFGSFLGSVIARNYLARLDENLQREFMNRLIKQAGEDAPPFLIDYVRLNVRAMRPE